MEENSKPKKIKSKYRRWWNKNARCIYHPEEYDPSETVRRTRKTISDILKDLFFIDVETMHKIDIYSRVYTYFIILVTFGVGLTSAVVCKNPLPLLFSVFMIITTYTVNQKIEAEKTKLHITHYTREKLKAEKRREESLSHD